MPGPSSPALSRRELIARLRQLRQRADLTIEEVAERMFVSSAKISRMETGARPVSLRDLSGLSPIYRLTHAEREHLFALDTRSREPGWWQEADATFMSEVSDLESSAEQVYEYQASFVPSLLQTESYARALVVGMRPKLSSMQTEERVKARTARQAHLLETGWPKYVALTDESALARQVGGMSVLLSQLQHMHDLASAANISVRVVPYTVGAYQVLGSPFMLFTFGDETVGDVAYVEGVLGHSFIDQESDLEQFKDAAVRLQELALTESDSIGLIRETIAVIRGRGSPSIP